MGALPALGCASTGDPAPTRSLASYVAEVVDRPPLDGVHWGILAVDGEGRTLVERNADRVFVPASNQKVLTTVAALALLGPDYRYRTALVSRAPVEDGTVRGDLVLPGSGDPTLSERYWPGPGAALEALADSLWAAGVRRVEGALVVDASAWDSTAVPGTWQAGDLPWRYAAGGGPFAVEEGETTLFLRGGAAAGDAAAVEVRPVGEERFVLSRLTTLPADSSRDVDPVWHPEARRLVLRGGVPAGSFDSLRVATRDPVGQAAAALFRALRERGIPVDGGWRVAWTDGESPLECDGGGRPTCAGARTLASLESPPMAAIVRGILEPSQNWMAEQVLKTLGAEAGEGGGWGEGTDVLERFLVEEVGVDSLDVEPRDGSGMSPYDMVTPRALVATLRWAAGRPWGATFRSALAEPGEEDSTLERRLEGLEGRVHAKTGTLTPVSALSGYLVRDDGGEVVFSIVANNSPVPSSVLREAIDRVVRILASGEGPVL